MPRPPALTIRSYVTGALGATVCKLSLPCPVSACTLAISLSLSLWRWRNDSGSVVSTRSVNFTELMSKFLSPKVGGEDKRWWWGKSVLKERLVEWRLHAMVSVSCPSRSQRTMIAWMRLPSGRRSSPCGGNPGSGTWTPCELLLWPSHVMPPPHLTLANNQRLA